MKNTKDEINQLMDIAYQWADEPDPLCCGRSSDLKDALTKALAARSAPVVVTDSSGQVLPHGNYVFNESPLRVKRGQGLVEAIKDGVAEGSVTFTPAPVAPAETLQPVAWRVRGYSQFRTGEPGLWRYIEGSEKPKVNLPESCDFEPLYRATVSSHQVSDLAARSAPIAPVKVGGKPLRMLTEGELRVAWGYAWNKNTHAALIRVIEEFCEAKGLALAKEQE